jgi:PurA ssDNA and RNA-binding protein
MNNHQLQLLFAFTCHLQTYILTYNMYVDVCQVSMTLPLSRQRPQVVIPAQGMIEVRDTLTDLLNEYGTDDKGMDELWFLWQFGHNFKILHFDVKSLLFP